MLKFTFEPTDVLYFGSGKPNNMGADFESIFPPFPHTFAGAISQKLKGSHNIDITKCIKKIYGPFIEKGNVIYFPKPLDILKERKEKELKSVILSELKQDFKLIKIQDTDLGEDINSLMWVKSENSDIDYEPFSAFISTDGLKKWLENKNVDKEYILKYEYIFEYEPRIGIKMNTNTHTTEKEDGLYRIQFLRLKKDIRFVFWVEFNSNNELSDKEKKDIFNKQPQILKLGGEMRTVSYTFVDSQFKLDIEMPSPKPGDIIKVLFLTHGYYDNGWRPVHKGLKFKTAVIGKYVNIGMRTQKYGTTLKRAIPAGSVFYYEVQNGFDPAELWLNPKDGQFIGCNLTVFSKW